jgi:hypothetical protein
MGSKLDLKAVPLPLICVLAVGLVAGVLGYATAGDGSKAPPPLSGTQETPVRGVVQAASGTELTIVSDGASVKLGLTPDTRIEVMHPVPVSSIRLGDWMNTGAVPHSQTVFALTGLVLLPQGSFEEPAR